MHIDYNTIVILYCDNQFARHIASNPTYHKHTKPINIDFLVVQDKIQVDLFHLLPIRSNEQLVDVFTIYLKHTSFKTIISKLGIMNIHYPV